MYRKLLIQVICSITVLMALQACESRISTEGDAFENEKNLREVADDTAGEKALGSMNGQVQIVDSQAIIAAHSPVNKSRKVSKAVDPWQTFQNSLTTQIAANETLIWHLKVLPNNAKNLKRVLAAERQNADLRALILKFQEDEKVTRDKFMVEVNTTLDAIATTLKESQSGNE